MHNTAASLQANRELQQRNRQHCQEALPAQLHWQPVQGIGGCIPACLQDGGAFPLRMQLI